MYNTDMPTRAELPSTKRLIRSTIVAIVAAAVILVTIVLPAEYAIDPTGIGRVLGLAEMGEIKQQLAKEAEEDKRRDQQQNAPQQRSSIGSAIASVMLRSAHAQANPAYRTDDMTITLQPGQGAEVKMEMKQGAKVTYKWEATADVNYDLHGDGSGKETSYKKGRSVTKDDGMLTASFDGNHGWFWRNRTKQPVTITLQVSGQQASLKRVL